jgi:hypothetical protein
VGIELGNLREHLAPDVRREVIGSHVNERSLEGAPNRGAASGDYYGFGHGFLLMVTAG